MTYEEAIGKECVVIICGNRIHPERVFENIIFKGIWYDKLWVIDKSEHEFGICLISASVNIFIKSDDLFEIR